MIWRLSPAAAPLVVAGLGLSLLAACTLTPPKAATRSPSASTVPALSGSPLIPADPYPAHDTPMAQAPATLQAAWRSFGITVIPGRDLFDTIPTLAPIRSGEGVPIAEARQVATALYRSNALFSWAEGHAQTRLRPRLAGQPYLIGKSGFAVAEGKSVIDPPCATYPTSVTVRRLDISTTQAMRGLVQFATEGYQLRLTFTEPCEIKVRAHDGSTSVLGITSRGPLVATGPVLHDPLLGDIFFTDTGAICDGTIPGLTGACAP